MLLFRRFIESKRGGVLIFMGLALGLLFAAMGIAIDMGRVFLVRAKAQTALDAAVISVAAISTIKTSDAELQARGEMYFDANFPTNLMGIATVKPTFSALPPNRAIVRGDLNFQMNTLFGPMIDALLPKKNAVSNVDLGVFSQVDRVMSDMDVEVALVLDFTASMCFTAGVYNTSCTKYNGMVDAVELFTSTIDGAVNSSVGGGEVFYSFVPFTHTVRVNGTIEHDSENLMGNLPNLHGLKEDGSTIVDILRNTFPDEYGNTNTAVGSYWGWKSLRAVDRNDFVGVSQHETVDHPAPFGDLGTFRMLLLLTDGKNTFLNSSNVNVAFELANDQQKEICALAKAEGIQIRVIPFEVADQSTKDMLKDDCASEPEYYYEASSIDDLEDAFEEIANDLINLRISK